MDSMMTSTILVCTFASLVGILIGLALAKMQGNAEAETAFERGRDAGKEEGIRESEEKFALEKDDIKDGLARQLAGIRDSIVKTVEAYEDAVQSVEEQFDLEPGALLGEGTDSEQRLIAHSRESAAANDSDVKIDSDLEGDQQEAILSGQAADKIIEQLDEEIRKEAALENALDAEAASRENGLGIESYETGSPDAGLESEAVESVETDRDGDQEAMASEEEQKQEASTPEQDDKSPDSAVKIH